MAEAIILAGGQGRRLRSVVSDVPKPMADVGGRPFLTYILDRLCFCGIRKVIISVGYKGDAIENYFGQTYKDLNLIYSFESSPLGTGGAIKEALKYISNDFFFVLNGDSIFDVKLERSIVCDGCKLFIYLKEMHDFDRYGSVKIDVDKNITAFTEKKHVEKGFINAGVYYMSRSIFDGFSMRRSFSFEQFMEINFSAFNAKGVVRDGFFIDIGIPSDYQKFKRLVDEDRFP